MAWLRCSSSRRWWRWSSTWSRSREEIGEVFELAPGGVEPAVDEPLGEEPLGAAGEAVETVGVGRDLLPGGAGLALGPAAGGLGEQPAEVAVAAVVGRQEGEAGEGRAGWSGGRGRGREGPSANFEF